MQHRDGHYVPMLSRGFILRDEAGRPVRISGTNTVITERKRAEDALRQSEAVLRAFVEASPFPAILSDIHGTFLYINPACVNTFGYALTDVPTMRAWRARAHPDLRYRRWVGSTWSKRLERARQSGRPFDPFEVIVRCKDGTERTVLASTVDLPGEATVSQSFVLIDVTEQRRLERGIIQAANREQSRLGMDLHDGLGQELTGLSLSLSGLSRRVRTGDAQVIEAELCSLTALAAQCIATTRAIAHGLSPLEPGCEGLRRALLRLCERGHIGDMQLKLNLVGLASRPLDHAPLDQAVGDSIYRIVQEALANAAKHSGATCTSIEAHRGRSSLTVSVRDNGRGMPAHIGSEGLGLRIMRYRAHAVGGHLDIESSPLTGTHVKCRFPLPH
jgi:PAS domain S-box-containing protein